MKKNLTILLLLCMVSTLPALAKRKIKAYNYVSIAYLSSYHGEVNKSDTTWLELGVNMAVISKSKVKNMPEETIYLDFATNKEWKSAKVKGEYILTGRDFEINKGLEETSETALIAGYNCKKVQTIINSNTIEIWYTNTLQFRGTMQPHVGIPNGVVLKVVRNGQSVQEAVKVERKVVKEVVVGPTQDLSTAIKPSAYNYRIQQSQVINVEVFKNQSIYFRNLPKVTKLSDTEVMQFAKGSIVLKKVKLPENNEDYSIFAELTQHSEGDAYDRTGSVFLIPIDKKQSFIDGLMKGKDALPQYIDKKGNSYEGMVVTADYIPPIELIRFYTSFGVKGYNHIEVAEYNWPDSVVFKQEVTDYAKELKGEAWVGAWIGNYVENGHNISLNLKYYPSKPSVNKEVYSLFTTTNILEMDGQAYPEAMFRNDTLTVDFETTSDLKLAYIKYTSTGHGGWGGGDEFNPKLNEIYLDGERIIGYTPWREDCGSYRGLNPASGNFSNGLSSSDLSRSGWCPGTVSYPVNIYLGDVKAGKHQIKLAIPVGDPAGNSHSYWCTSAVLVGEKN